MEGYLLKWTNYILGWQKRYFVLWNGTLQYSRQQGEDPRGTIHLDVSQIFPHQKNKLRFFIDTGLTILHLKASSAQQATQWIQNLFNAKLNQENADLSPSILRETFGPQQVTRQVSLHGNLGEMWSIHAQMQALIDLLPLPIQNSTPGLARVLQLCNQMKIMASNTVQMIEQEQKSKVRLQQRVSGYCLDFSMSANEAPHSYGAEIQFTGQDSDDEFVDAVSHLSEIEQRELELPFERKCLPVLRSPYQNINVWKHIKGNGEGSMRQIEIPLIFYQPLSLLQRISEDLVYSQVLLKACQSPDAELRIAFVSAFIVSGLASTYKRVLRPFSPLVGETFELEKDGFQYLGEQVTEQISSFYCTHPKFTYYGNLKFETRIEGGALGVIPSGVCHLLLHQFQDHFVWEKPQTKVQNIGIGKPTISHCGTVKVTNLIAGQQLEFLIEENTSVKSVTNLKYKLKGYWNRGIDIVCPQHSIQAWKVKDKPQAWQFNYFFSDFSLQLNLFPELYLGLPKTDSRQRRDIRALEFGQIQVCQAEHEKIKQLEEEPRWFVNNKGDWVYTGGYWKSRQPRFRNLA